MTNSTTIYAADADRKLLYALCEAHVYKRQPLSEEVKVAQIVGPGCMETDIQSRLKFWAQNIASSKVFERATLSNILAAQAARQQAVPGPAQSTAFPGLSSTAPTMGSKDTNINNKREATEGLKEDAKRFCTSGAGDPAAEDIIVRLGIRIGKLEEKIMEKDVDITEREEEIKRRDGDLRKRGLELENQTRKFEKVEKEDLERRKVSQTQLQNLRDLKAKYKDSQSQHEATQTKSLTHVAEVRLLHAKGLERDQEISKLKTRAEGFETKIKAQAGEIETAIRQRNLERKRTNDITVLFELKKIIIQKMRDGNMNLRNGQASAEVCATEELKKRQEVEEILSLRDARIAELEERLKSMCEGLKALATGKDIIISGANKGNEGVASST